MYGSLQELCELEEKSGKPFWKIVQEDDCRAVSYTHLTLPTILRV